jgi:transforming growth factor-beta-induced protein
MRLWLAILAFAFGAGQITTEASADTLADGIKKIPELSILAKAVEASGLSGMLNDSAKTWTLFAPTDDAFKKLPAGVLENLLKPENKEKLQGLIKYHLVDGALLTAGVAAKSSKVKSAEGRDIALVVGGLSVNGATVHGHDIFTDNGVIHAIDTVIHPK